MEDFYSSMKAWLTEECATIVEAAQPHFQNKESSI
jgi:hypothetical protein